MESQEIVETKLKLFKHYYHRTGCVPDVCHFDVLADPELEVDLGQLDISL
jgi:hypothetical protein